jgi:murein DD-endopeptidase MepM/ murein hydrolase activator NlpD
LAPYVLGNPIASSDGTVTGANPGVGQGDGRCGPFRRSRLHRGTDIKAPVGTPVEVVEDGVVIATRSNWHSIKNTLPATQKALGNFVIVRHTAADGRRYVTMYFHLLGAGQPVKGQQLRKGEVLGVVGRTGNVPAGAAAHLHFEVRMNGPKGRVVCPSIGPGRDAASGVSSGQQGPATTQFLALYIRDPNNPSEFWRRTWSRVDRNFWTDRDMAELNQREAYWQSLGRETRILGPQSDAYFEQYLFE